MRGRTLQSTTTGALPIINVLVRRTRLEELLEVALPKRPAQAPCPSALPKEDRRVRSRSSQAILLLVRNILPIREKTDDDGTVVDVFATSEQPTQTVEGYRLLWFHGVAKSQCDAVARIIEECGAGGRRPAASSTCSSPSNSTRSSGWAARKRSSSPKPNRLQRKLMKPFGMNPATYGR